MIDNDNIISDDKKVAETFNDLFSNAVANLDIKGYKTNVQSNITNDNIVNIIIKFKDHPSILKIKQIVNIKAKFSFTIPNATDIENEIRQLNINKPTTLNNIPSKLLVENNDYVHP